MASTPCFEINLSDDAELSQRKQEFEEGGGLLVPSTLELELRSPVSLQINCVNVKCEVLAEVVFRQGEAKDFSYGLAFGEDALKEVRRFFDQVEGATVEGQNLWGKDAYSISEHIKTMTMPEKIQMAVRCGRTERHVLRKASLALWQYLLKNPRISTEEVSQMARQPQMTSECIIYISKNSEWMSQKKIQMALVQNVKSPLNIVRQIMPSLNDPDLIFLAKSNSVKEAVSREARRLLASRGRSWK